MTYRLGRVSWIVLVTVLGAVVRVHGAVGLPMDHDEPVTLEASIAYAEAWEARDLNGLASVETNLEHPGLVKAFYGLGMVALDDNATRVEHLAVGRGLSVGLGVACVALVAWVHPVAGLFVALHGLHIKYSAQMYLEAGAGLAAIGGVLLWFRARRRPSWAIWGSAVCFGAAAAAKYVHVIPVLVVLGDLVLLAARGRRRGWEPAMFILVCLGSFWLLNPQVWSDSIASTWASLSFHPSYAQELASTGLSAPPWVFWKHLGLPMAMMWHPGMSFLPVEPVFLIAGLFAVGCGVRRGSPEAGILALWFLCVAVFLMAWPTRWPQHAMGAIGPLAIALAIELRTRADRRYPAL